MRFHILVGVLLLALFLAVGCGQASDSFRVPKQGEAGSRSQTTKNPEEMYSGVLAQYREVVANNFYIGIGKRSAAGKDVNSMMIDYARNGDCLYYAFYDIDHNGVPELIVGTDTYGDDVCKCDIFTWDGQQPVCLLRTPLVNGAGFAIYDGGVIVTYGSGGGGSYNYQYQKISPDGQSLTSLVFTSYYEGVYSQGRDDLDQEQKEITKKQFSDFARQYTGKDLAELKTDDPNTPFALKDGVVLDWKQLKP